MGDYFRDFVDPVKTIFNRLQQQKGKGVIINGKDGLKSNNVPPPFYPNLPEYPCKLIRGTDGKVTEVQYGKSSRGYVWRQLIIRATDGKVSKITQENPDGSFDIVFTRNVDDKVELISIE